MSIFKMPMQGRVSITDILDRISEYWDMSIFRVIENLAGDDSEIQSYVVNNIQYNRTDTNSREIKYTIVTSEDLEK